MSTGHELPMGSASNVAATQQVQRCQAAHGQVPYLSFPDYCKRLEKKGERQLFCGMCQRFKFDSERCAIFMRTQWRLNPR